MGRKSQRKAQRKAAPTLVEIVRNSDFPGSLPGYISLAQRQFEKTVPEPLKRLGAKLVTYQVPVDLFRMTCPDYLARDVISIELTYRERQA
jgi:hypothetical protein